MFKFLVSIINKSEFIPFTIVMDDGERIAVTSREFIIAIPGFELVLLHRPVDKDVRVIDPGHIRELMRPDTQSISS